MPSQLDRDRARQRRAAPGRQLHSHPARGGPGRPDPPCRRRAGRRGIGLRRRQLPCRDHRARAGHTHARGSRPGGTDGARRAPGHPGRGGRPPHRRPLSPGTGRRRRARGTAMGGHGQGRARTAPAWRRRCIAPRRVPAHRRRPGNHPALQRSIGNGNPARPGRGSHRRRPAAHRDPVYQRNRMAHRSRPPPRTGSQCSACSHTGQRWCGCSTSPATRSPPSWQAGRRAWRPWPRATHPRALGDQLRAVLRTGRDARLASWCRW